MAKKLSRLELRVMEVLWEQGPASVREVQEAFPAAGRPAYTTVQTTMYRLEAKQAIRRVKKIGNAHIFEAVVSRTLGPPAARGRAVGGVRRPHPAGHGPSHRDRKTDARRSPGSRKDVAPAGGEGAHRMIIATHLWQSTLCLAAAALLCAMLRQSSARTRQRIWLCASAKFLVPFAAIAAAGRLAALWAPVLTAPGGSSALGWLDRPLAVWNLDVTAGGIGVLGGSLGPWGSTGLLIVWASGAAGLAAWRWRQWRAVSHAAREATPLVAGREARALARVTRRSSRPRRIELLQCPAPCEPGVYGVFRPRLLWPLGLSDRLGDAELQAVLTHEAVHVDRHDNLAAAIQMAVETIFWFFPPVWWLGSRLLDERERACDEDVLRMGTDERRYAAGIVEVCGFCLRAPACVRRGGGRIQPERPDRADPAPRHARRAGQAHSPAARSGPGHGDRGALRHGRPERKPRRCAGSGHANGVSGR